MNTFSNTRMYLLQVQSPLHVGVGQGVGFIDQPISREKVTHWPIVPGSAVKGVMRAYFQAQDGVSEDFVNVAFGKAPSSGIDSEGRAGAVVFTDARIVVLPIRSYYGTFAYVTSPLALSRLRRDIEMVGGVCPADDIEIPEYDDRLPIYHAGNSKLVKNGMVYLEELDFHAQESDLAAKWAETLAAAVYPDDEIWRKLFVERFAIVPDDTFNYFCETATEVNARVRIESSTKTVARGALWYEENLPVETVLAGVVWCERVYGQSTSGPETILSAITGRSLNIQLGCNATIGRGRVRCLFSNGGER